MKKLWQKDWKLDSFIEHFETKDDILLDQKMIKHDVYNSLAHTKMLHKIGILSTEELTNIRQGLLEVLNQTAEGKFILQPGDEDIHTKIENFITEKYPQAGQKIHTARSRNDQVLTDIRLFTKEQLLTVWNELLLLIESFYQFSKKFEYIPMPGYTHMQKAMPSSIGMWAGAFTESLLDDCITLKAAYELNNQSPLGSAAGYGIPLTIDRTYTAKLLGFANLQINSLYCQNSRGKIEAAILSALCAILQDINKFATDVLLFTTTEFNYFKVDPKLCSGSSIMPQKQNVDIAELLRSKIHIVLGQYIQILSLASNLPSGYNRDVQDTKKPLMESLELTNDCIKVANILINNLTPQKENLKQALTSEIFATHQALDLVAQGIPFRQAYQTIGANLSALTKNHSEKSLKQATHLGATGNLGLKNYAKRLKKETQTYKKEQQNFSTAINKLLENTHNQTQNNE